MTVASSRATDLNIFVGYASDSEELADHISSCEQALQDHLDLLQHAIMAERPFDRVKVFAWQNDADTTIGGQRSKIDPAITNSQIAVFPFVGRVGRVTKLELNEFLQRSAGRRVLALFPLNPPANIHEPSVAADWSELQMFRLSLTSDWNDAASSAITPLPLYVDFDDYTKLCLSRVKEAISHAVAEAHQSVVRGALPTPRGMPGPHLAPALFTLDAKSSAKLDNVDWRSVASFRSGLRSEVSQSFPENLDGIEFLRRAHFLIDDALTHLGVLLFTSIPSLYVAGARLQCSAWEQDDMGVEHESIMINSPVTDQIVTAWEFIDRRVKHLERRSETSPVTTEHAQYSRRALREIIANAVVHRDYGDSARIVHVRLFPHRIDVLSPGSWPRATAEGAASIPVPLGHLAGPSNKRNPSLAFWMIASRLAEGEGSGIPVATVDSERIDAPEPTVQVLDNTVTVTLYPSDEFQPSAGAFRGDVIGSGLLADFRGTLTVSGLTDSAGTVVSVASVEDPYFIVADLRLRGDRVNEVVGALEGDWVFTAFAESIGPGPEGQVGSANIPLSSGSRGRWRARIPVNFVGMRQSSGPELSGIVKLIITLTNSAPHGTETMAGFVEAGLLRISE